MIDIFAYGLGYCALRLIRANPHLKVVGTVRSSDSALRLAEVGIGAFIFDESEPSAEMVAACREARTILVSIPPDAGGDPVLRKIAPQLASSECLQRVIYLSTVGVYGDWRGEWVFENSELRTTSRRGRQRIAAEREWQDFGSHVRVPVHILRLAGIYGPERNVLVKLRNNYARRIVKPGQVFNRTHVDDIGQVIRRLTERDLQGEVWNVADDEPAPPQDVVAFGAELLGLPAPPEEPFDAAVMSEMSASFYADNRRVSNDKLKLRLGINLLYPTYREGLRAIAG